MHSRNLLEGTINLVIRPDGPLLVKAGEGSGADPTRPDMEFVRTRRGGHSPMVYVPGSSFKGAIRSQCERICRTLDRPDRDPDRDDPPLADNPLGSGTHYNGVDDMEYNSGHHLAQLRNAERDTAMIYRRASLISQMFGHAGLAGRIRFADAYAIDDPVLEERNSVAIDRIYGTVAVGPFNYETVVDGTFVTRIDFRNITLAQLALLGLALRDLTSGRILLGFGRSRGLGRVLVTIERLNIRYPACELIDNVVQVINGQARIPAHLVAGVGALCDEATCRLYGLSADDTAILPEGLAYIPDDLLGVQLTLNEQTVIAAFWRACMPAWKRKIGW